MQYDYYAYCKEKLGNSLSELEQARKISDKTARNQAMNKAATDAVKVEAHLSYLWYEALDSELKNYIRDAWQKNLIVEEIPEDFRFSPKISDLENLPELSFMLRVPFKLKKPYLSKDDRSFHILDNPVRKDKVFQTPMVAPTSWKGALRAALWQIDPEKYKKDNKQIIRLFGDAHDDEKGQSGRLYFYPTFFDKIGLEVINPHDRKKGTSKRGPIYLECVPKDATGELVILYVPFGKVEKSQVIEDLKLVVQGVKAMLTTYGFGAKTSSGFGIGDISTSEDFPTKEEYKKSKRNKPYRENMYEKAKACYEQNKILPPTVYFANSSELCDRAQEIVQNLSNS